MCARTFRTLDMHAPSWDALWSRVLRALDVHALTLCTCCAYAQLSARDVHADFTLNACMNVVQVM